MLRYATLVGMLFVILTSLTICRRLAYYYLGNVPGLYTNVLIELFCYNRSSETMSNSCSLRWISDFILECDV
jgi:hypothetical protein